jgi:hypothetical protein
LKEVMKTTRAFRALNAAGQVLELRTSSKNWNLSIKKCNIKLKIVEIVTMRAILTLRVIKNNSVLSYIQISIGARTAILHSLRRQH